MEYYFSKTLTTSFEEAIQIIDEALKKNLKEAFILTDVFGSDHCPVGIEIEI